MIFNKRNKKISPEDQQNTINSIENQLDVALEQLKKKSAEIVILNELSEFCYTTFNSEEILHYALERLLALTNSDVGSTMMLESDRKSFVIKASIGLNKIVKKNKKVDFETSIAKYAVINKFPIIVEDIEKDNRFGRINRLHYATKSFICIPVKTSRKIIGVFTISRRNSSATYTSNDVEALMPLITNAAFAYDNICLFEKNEQNAAYLKFIERTFKLTSSSLRDGELLQAFLHEIQEIMPVDSAIVITKDENITNNISVVDFLFSKESANVFKKRYYDCQDSIVEKVIKQGNILIVDDINALSEKIEKQIFARQGCKSCLLAPLKTDGNITGILVLFSQKSEIFYNTQKFINLIADGFSIVVERNNLYASIIKRDEELNTLKQIGSALASSTFEVELVLKYTVDMIQALMNVETGSLLLLKDNELEFVEAFDVDVESLKKFRLELGQGVAGYVAARGEAVIVNDTKKSPHFYAKIDNSTGFITKSILCVPMISHGKVLGVIEVLNKMNGDFSESDKNLLQSIASSVSIAIQNAHLYKETVAMAEHERGIRNMFQKFVPREIVDKIISEDKAGKVLVDELKTLTLLNIDIRGFSKLVKQIGSQKTVLMLNHFFSVMGEIVFKYNGIVDKYLGDGFLAIFGAPISSSKDGDNAVEAALEMKKEVNGLNDYFAKELNASISIGISIHTGEMVVGNFGFDKKMDYTVIGDSVNFVFRLQEASRAFPNGILISENTAQAVLSKLKTRRVNDISEMKIYELLGYDD